MAGFNLTTPSKSIPITQFNGGLNSTSGPLGLQINESSSLQNIDFDKFGSILKRNGYTAVNTSALSGSPQITSLRWYEMANGTRTLVATAGTTLIYWNSTLSGAPTGTITGALTITAGVLVDTEIFLNTYLATNGTDLPFQWAGSGNGAVIAGIAGGGSAPTITKAKFVKTFQNYTILANVVESGTSYFSRFYWSAIKSISSWDAADFIDVSLDDGQTITGLKVLGDRLVVFKERSIHVVTFTGDADIPFTVQKSNSDVGCINHFSIQEANNGLIFLATDGLYIFDGNNSYKISDKVTTTLLGLATNRFNVACSMYQHNKNRYWLSLTTSGGSSNNRVLVWDSFNEAFSIYKGHNASSMCIVYSSGTDERPYFGDYSGFVYRADTGTDDYPLNAVTAIDAYYYTRWESFEELVGKKVNPHLFIYYQNFNATLTHSYSYDFNSGDQYSSTFSTASSGALWGTAVWGSFTWAKEGGDFKKRDLRGSGRLIRHKVSNMNAGETFQINGIGYEAYMDTNV